MNWLTFTVLAYVGLALQILLAPQWSIGENEPMLLLVLLVFVALQAPGLHAAWAAVLLGVMTDVYRADYQTGLIGPWALGMLVASYALVQMRNLLFKDSMFTISIMTLVAGIFALLVATTLHAVRDNAAFLGSEPVAQFSAARQLYEGFGMLLYTSVIAIPAGYLLLRMQPLFGFSARRSTR